MTMFYGHSLGSSLMTAQTTLFPLDFVDQHERFRNSATLILSKHYTIYIEIVMPFIPCIMGADLFLSLSDLILFDPS